MTMQEAFHFPSLVWGFVRSPSTAVTEGGMDRVARRISLPSLVWDRPIAIYLFLLGISAGATTLSVPLRRKGAGSESGIIKATAILAPVSGSGVT